MGLIRPLSLYKTTAYNFNRKKWGLLGAGLIGAAFAFGWTPCIGPILGGILTYAGTLEHTNQGVGLLFIYSLGLGTPFLLTAIAINQFFKVFNKIKKHLGLIEKISGLIMVVLGLMIFTNSLALIPGYLTFFNKFAL
jgi:cytochrome c-type biogenesis protein